MTTCAPLATLPELKKGDTFSIGGTVTGLSSDVALTARITDPLNDGATVADLVCTLGAFVDLVTARTLLIVAPAPGTTAWPIGLLRGDLKFVEPGGITIHSRTFVQPVVHAETP